MRHYRGRSKYNNSKTEVNGIKFDSRKEANRYIELQLLEKARAIQDLRLQVPFEIVPKQKDERRVVYKADFVYSENGKTIVEDVKGYRTDVYKIKRKLFKYLYPDHVFREV